MVTEFMPGPWIANDEEFSEAGDYTPPQVFSYADKDDPKIVCELAVRSGMEANAQLIAAAPEMYAALELALPFFAEEQQVLERSYLPEPNDEESAGLERIALLIKVSSAALAKADGKQEPKTPTIADDFPGWVTP